MELSTLAMYRVVCEFRSFESVARDQLPFELLPRSLSNARRFISRSSERIWIIDYEVPATQYSLIPASDLLCARFARSYCIRLRHSYRRSATPWLLYDGRCTTLSYMKNASVTIRPDAKLQRDLDRLSRQLGRRRSDLVRDAVRRQLALLRFETARRTLLPLAEAQNVLTMRMCSRACREGLPGYERPHQRLHGARAVCRSLMRVVLMEHELVSGDQDLLEVADASPVPILTSRLAWKQLRRDRDRVV